MAKTSRDARKHIRELSELFSDVNTVGCAVVEDLLNKHKQRKYLKQSLRRLIEKGFLLDDGEKISPTRKGFMLFKRLQSKKERPLNSRVRWDGKWRLVSFDVPCNKYDNKRKQIRSLLKEFNFFQLQKSVWICPTLVSKDFWKMLINDGLDKYCKVMVVNIIEGDEDLRRYFKLLFSLLVIIFAWDFLPETFLFS